MSIMTFGDELEHIVLERSLDKTISPKVRIHSECLTGDVFNSHRCDCGEQLEKSLEIVGAADHGFIFYLRQEGRGIGLVNKLKSYNLQEQGYDTIEANHMLGFDTDLRDYAIVAQFLNKRGVNAVELITNNPDKCDALRAANIEVKRIPMATKTNSDNEKYKDAKIKKMGHFGH